MAYIQVDGGEPQRILTEADFPSVFLGLCEFLYVDGETATVQLVGTDLAADGTVYENVRVIFSPIGEFALGLGEPGEDRVVLEPGQNYVKADTADMFEVWSTIHPELVIDHGDTWSIDEIAFER